MGSVKLVKYRRNNKIYVLNILNKSINEKEIKVLSPPNPFQTLIKLDEKKIEGFHKNIIRQVAFLKTLRDVTKLTHPNLIELEHFWV